MKTYTRRKQILGFIENVHEICRLCLQKIDDTETVELFTSESEKTCPSLTMKIMACLGFEIVIEECLPKLICTDCFDKINKYYIFRKKCGIAYHALKSHSLAVKSLHHKGDATSKQQDDSSNVHSAVASYDKCEEGSIILSFEEGQQLKVVSSDEVVDIDSDGLLNGANENNNSEVPEISNFLTDILLELGVVEKTVNFLKSDFIDNIIELETGDGCQMTLQLLESNEEANNSVSQTPAVSNVNETPSSTLKKQDEEQNGRVCPECGKQFASRGVLRRHARVHTGERPFACRSCPRRFSQREVLRRHELVHAEIRPYPCDVCSKSFTQRGALAAHARSHLTPAARSLALHRCVVCPKMFLHASGLSRHMREHSGQAALCDICSREFRDRSSLIRHRRTHTCGARTRNDADKTAQEQLQTSRPKILKNRLVI